MTTRTGTPGRVVNRERFSNAGVVGMGGAGPRSVSAQMREYSQSPGGSVGSGRSASPTASGASPASNNNNPTRPLRWNISWKILLMGFIVVYQVVSLLTMHPTENDNGRTWLGMFSRSARQEQENDILSAPVAPEHDIPDNSIFRYAGGTWGGGASKATGGTSRIGTTPSPLKETKSRRTKHPTPLPQLKDPTAGKGKAVIADVIPTNAPLQSRRERLCPMLSVFLGYMGATFALGFSCMGAGIGIAKAGNSIAFLGMENRAQVLRGMLPVIMSELLSIYGLISAVSISLEIGNSKGNYPLGAGCVHLASGLTVGLSSLITGVALGTVGQECNIVLIRTKAVFTVTVLMLIFCEALALYGLIAALLMNGVASNLIASTKCGDIF